MPTIEKFITRKTCLNFIKRCFLIKVCGQNSWQKSLLATIYRTSTSSKTKTKIKTLSSYWRMLESTEIYGNIDTKWTNHWPMFPFSGVFRGYKIRTLARNGLIKSNIWDKVFKNGPSKICGRQPLKNVSSTNFTWSILEYFVSYKPPERWPQPRMCLSASANAFLKGFARWIMAQFHFIRFYLHKSLTKNTP